MVESTAAGTLQQPTWAELARTAVAGAGVGTLMARDHRRADAVPTLVRLEEQDGGVPLVVLDAANPAVERLLRCPVATLVVPGTEEFPTVQLVGTFRPVRCERGDRRIFRPTLLFVCLGGVRRQPVPVDAFRAAEPDPLAAVAVERLRHLEEEHADDLRVQVLSLGHDADHVVPRSLDRYGLSVTVLASDGVRSLRLPLPACSADRETR